MKNILLDFIIIISPHGKGKKILNNLQGLINFPSITRGKGTATSEVLSALGIGEPEKDIIFAFCEKKTLSAVYDKLNTLFPSRQDGIIAMTIPVSAVGGNLTLQVLLGKTKDLF